MASQTIGMICKNLQNKILITAVRYLKANDAQMAGNAGKIISNDN